MGGDMTPLHFAKFAYGQLFGKLPVPSASFAGKTVIVTGSNVGLGTLNLKLSDLTIGDFLACLSACQQLG